MDNSEAFEVDPDLVKDIRSNFDARRLTERLFETCASMADCIGVAVKWEVQSVDKGKKVESAKLSSLISQLVTISSAFCLGGHLNPIKLLAGRERRVKKAKAAAAHRQATATEVRSETDEPGTRRTGGPENQT